MPKPIAVCIEDFSPDLEAPKFVSCVALPGRQPGLRLDAGGAVLWKSDDAVACELWVSADDCLILYRPEGAPGVMVHRAGRSLNVPFGKPVVIIDQDKIDVDERKLRLHVHGQATDVCAPSEVVPKQSGLRRLGRAAAAALVLGSAVVAGTSISCRDQPPVPVEPPIDQPGEKQPYEKLPIDVRDRPPVLVPKDLPGETKPPKDNQNNDDTVQDK